MIELMNESLEPPYHLSREEKLKWLMKAYGNDIIRIAFTYVKQKQLAEDVVQDVFIKCYEKMNTFRFESTYKTWLISITINRCKDMLRSWSYKNLLFTDYLANKLRDSSTERHIFDDTYEVLSNEILKLPLKLREVIILHYYQELSIEEISNLLRANSNTIKTRLHRGRLKLKAGIKGGENHE
jgi:RNA polymerase sigma factor (sigma-70 family)